MVKESIRKREEKTIRVSCFVWTEGIGEREKGRKGSGSVPCGKEFVCAFRNSHIRV